MSQQSNGSALSPEEATVIISNGTASTETSTAPVTDPASAPKQKGKNKNKNKEKGKGKNKNKRKNKLKGKKRGLTAKTADRLDLYQRSVNSPETDVDFALKVFEDLRERPLRHFREDFCGTASMTAEFLSRDEQNTAEGFDLDSDPMDWGREHNFSKVSDGDDRMTFHLADVREPSDKRPDMTVAQNFSYFCFKQREELLNYFRGIHKDLAADGIFIMDIYGGPDALMEQEEEREIDDNAFTYVWDQVEYWPGTGEYKCAIHFRFNDGTEMTNAFTYDWRLWGFAEVKDILFDAGFKAVRPYFEGTDEDDEEEGNGEFDFDEKGENCIAWIGYLVALK